MADPELLGCHISHLAAYLKGDSSVTAEQQMRIVHGVAVILSKTLPLVDDLSPEDLDDMESDLKALVMTMRPVVLSPVLMCLSSICARHQDERARTLESLAQTFFSYLRKKGVQSKALNAQSGDTSAHLNRALYTLGLVCRHGSLDSELGEDVDVSGGSGIFVKSYKIYRQYLDLGPTLRTDLRMRALDGTCP